MNGTDNENTRSAAENDGGGQNDATAIAAPSSDESGGSDQAQQRTRVSGKTMQADGSMGELPDYAKRAFPTPAHERFFAQLCEAFAVPESGVVIEKTQTGKRGRLIWLPLLTLFATALYGFMIYCTNWTRLELRYFLIAVETLVYAYFLARFILCFTVDILSGRHAETIYATARNGMRVYVTRGRYMEKLEYEGVRLVFWGKDNYETFEDKGKVNPLASRYSKALQRRSSNYAVFDPWSIYDRLAGGAPVELVRGAWCRSETSEGALDLLLDPNGRIKEMCFTGGKELLYDSCSPIHVMDTKLPFSYRYSYRFTYTDDGEPLVAPAAAKTALRDYLLPDPPDGSVTFG